MRVAILVPTTAGPRLVTALVVRPKLPTSLVITADDYRPLGEISARYDALVGPAGPLRSALGLGGGSFELRLDAAIESGRSWELPVALAHALAARGAEIAAAEPDLVVWATGALDPDLKVKPDDYHVADKLALSRAVLTRFASAGARIVMLLPPGAGDGLVAPGEAAAMGNPEMRSVASLATAMAAITAERDDVPDKGRVSVLAGSEPGPDKTWPRLLAALSAVMLAAAVAALLIWRPFEPGPVVPADPGSQQGADAGIAAADDGAPQDGAADNAAAALLQGLEIVARRDPVKRGCIAYLFREGATEDATAVRSGNGFALGDRQGLCAIALHLGAADGAVELALSDGLAALVMESERRGTLRLQPGERFELPLVQGGEGDLAIVVDTAPDGPGRFRLRLQVEEE